MYVFACSPEIFKCKQNNLSCHCDCGYWLLSATGQNQIIHKRSGLLTQNILTRLLKPPNSKKFRFAHEDSDDGEGADDDNDDGIYWRSHLNQSNPSIIAQALREIGFPIFLLRKLLKTSFEFEKTFHKTTFCCKNPLRSEINPHRFESHTSLENVQR